MKRSWQQTPAEGTDDSNSGGGGTDSSESFLPSSSATTVPDGSFRLSLPSRSSTSCSSVDAVVPTRIIADKEPRCPQTSEMLDYEWNGRMYPSETSCPSVSTAAETASRLRASSPITNNGPIVPKKMAVFVRILFKYLERVDIGTLALAKKILQDCAIKQRMKDSKFATLSDAVRERVRNAVGEAHWSQAESIHTQLVISRQQKKKKSKGGEKKGGELELHELHSIIRRLDQSKNHHTSSIQRKGRAPDHPKRASTTDATTSDSGDDSVASADFDLHLL